MTAQMPKFNFKSSISEEDLKREESKPRGSFFEPGTYDLQVIDSTFHKMSEGDPTWMVVKILLGGIDDRSIAHYLLVPTSRAEYRKPGKKDTMMMIGKFREFLRGVGINPELSGLNAVLTKHFSDLSSLIGKSATVVIGFEGPHAKRNPDINKFTIVDKFERENVFDNQFDDRDSAVAFAAEAGIELKNFTKVTKFEVSKAIKEASNDGW